MLPSVAAIVAERNLQVLRSTDTTSTLTDWILSGNYSTNLGQTGTLLAPHQPKTFAAAVANDASRLLLAGRETLNAISSIRDVDKVHPAWSSIQMYYAAFYYTSAALRIVGISQSFFRVQELARLRLYLAAYNQISLPGTGLYQLNFNQQLNSVRISKVDHGTHEALWHGLRDYIDSLKGRLNGVQILTESEKDTARSELDIITRASAGLNSQSNLSSTRNDVQYRQRLSCWYPNAREVRRFHQTDRIAQALSPDFGPASVLQGSDSYDDFFTRCLAICGFIHQVIMESAETSDLGVIAAKYQRYHKALAA